MKDPLRSIDPTRPDLDPQRTYIGTDGRWLMAIPLATFVLLLMVWAGAATVQRANASAAAAAPIATPVAVVANMRGG